LLPGKRTPVLPIALILGVYCLLTAACAGRGSGNSTPPEDDWTFKVEGSLTLDEKATEALKADSTETAPAEPIEDTAPVQPVAQAIAEPESTVAEIAPPEAAVPEPVTTTIPGFRVQVFSSSSADRAKLVADEAKYLLKEKTYINAAGNLFRVQAGDCLTRREAELFREKCRLAGYKDSFIVAAQIEVTRSP
jgi:hypothetical protein